MARKTYELVEVDNTGRPVIDSENGKTNSHSHYCDIVMHSKSYAACLNLIKERDSGRLESLYADCSVAISKKRCPALAMRKEEIEAGYAIYFKERIKHLGDAFMNAPESVMHYTDAIVGIKTSKSGFKRGEIQVIASGNTGKSLIIDDAVAQPSMGGYSDAINNALKNALKNGEVPIQLAEPKKPLKEIVAIEGESLMDLARRMMSAQ